MCDVCFYKTLVSGIKINWINQCRKVFTRETDWANKKYTHTQCTVDCYIFHLTSKTQGNIVCISHDTFFSLNLLAWVVAFVSYLSKSLTLWYFVVAQREVKIFHYKQLFFFSSFFPARLTHACESMNLSLLSRVYATLCVPLKCLPLLFTLFYPILFARAKPVDSIPSNSEIEIISLVFGKSCQHKCWSVHISAKSDRCTRSIFHTWKQEPLRRCGCITMHPSDINKQVAF